MKTKFILLLSFFLIIGTLTYADHVPIDVAKQVAKNYFSEKSDIKQNNIVFSEVITVEENNTDMYYIFNLSNGEGFIIISAEDAFTPVLGYSLKNKYVIENQPENIKYWMQTYTDQIMYIKENNISADNKIANEWKTYTAGNFIPQYNKTKAVEPLVGDILWNQDDDWNMLCPEDEEGPGGNVLAGCVATAMSIIMYYWQYPIQGIGYYSYYLYPYGTIYANFGETTYIWSNMLDAAPTYYSAKLMYHCGVAVNMGYSPEGSGAYPDHVPSAIETYFGYDNASYKSKASYTNANWIALLKEQLNNGYPIYYSGSDDDNGGHAFVCSGYDDSDYFHYNFGWGSSNNGYYTVTDVGGFHNGQAAVINFYPTSANYDVANVGYINEPVQNFSAEINTENTADFQVDLEWEAPAKGEKNLTGYEIYRQEIYTEEEVIATDLSPSTLTYSDIITNADDIKDYFYAVRAKYSDEDALCASEFVDTKFNLVFNFENADGNFVSYVTITLDGTEQVSGPLWMSYFNNIPFGWDYPIIIEHDDFETLETTINIFEDAEYTVIMGESILPTSLENNVKSNSINIFPNPTEGQFKINNLTNNSNILITDITGRIIYQNNVNSNELTIDLSEQPTGVYFINISDNKTSYTQKLIVQ